MVSLGGSAVLTQDQGQRGLLVLVRGLEGGFFQTLGADAIQGARSVLENRVKGKAPRAWPAGR